MVTDALGFPLFLPDKFRFVRYFKASDIPKTDHGICAWCRGVIVKGSGRRRYCSIECSEEVRRRIFINWMTAFVWKRCAGLCEECGITVGDIETLLWQCKLQKPNYFYGPENKLSCETWMRQWGPWYSYSTLFAVHHIVSVQDGGGCCGPENLQGLCIKCHKAKHAKRLSKQQEITT